VLFDDSVVDEVPLVVLEDSLLVVEVVFLEEVAVDEAEELLLFWPPDTVNRPL
jgi:hypothetical protein